MAAFGEIVDGIAHELQKSAYDYRGARPKTLKSGGVEPENVNEYAARITYERRAYGADGSKDRPTLRTVLVSKRVPGDLNSVLRSALEEIKARVSKAGIELAVEFAKELPPLDMDAASLKVAFTNILQNSLEAIERGGMDKAPYKFRGRRYCHSTIARTAAAAWTLNL